LVPVSSFQISPLSIQLNTLDRGMRDPDLDSTSDLDDPMASQSADTEAPLAHNSSKYLFYLSISEAFLHKFLLKILGTIKGKTHYRYLYQITYFILKFIGPKKLKK
jgi:hypothetical protein